MKTISLKKVAVVAVASLGFGLLSVVPAYAANSVIICDVADGRAAGDYNHGDNAGSTCNGVAGAANSVTIDIDTTADDSRMTVTGGKFLSTTDDTNIVIAADGLSATIGTVGDGEDLVVATPTVGTVTVSYFNLVNVGIYSSTADETVAVSVKATASSGAFVAATSGAVMSADATADYMSADDVFNTDDTIVAGISDGLVALIAVYTRDALKVGVNKAVSAVISGSGLIASAVDEAGLAAATFARATSLTPTDTTTTDAYDNGTGLLDAGDEGQGLSYIGVSSDGTAGKGTISIYQGTTLISTKTVVFYGDATAVAATAGLKVLNAAGGTNGSTDASDIAAATAIPAAVVTVTDKNGNPVTGGTVTVSSSDTSVVSTGTCVEDAETPTPGTFNCSLTTVLSSSGKSADVTFVTTGAASAEVKSAAIKYTVGGKIAAVTAAFDKTSYAAGEAVVVTYSVKDSAGNTAYDGIHANFFATGGVSFNYGTGISTSAVDKATIGGVFTIKAFAPLSGGSIIATSTLGTSADIATATQGTVVTATSSVANANSSLLTQIDALNAKIVALNALIAKIMKKLGVK